MVEEMAKKTNMVVMNVNVQNTIMKLKMMLENLDNTTECDEYDNEPIIDYDNNSEERNYHCTCLIFLLNGISNNKSDQFLKQLNTLGCIKNLKIDKTTKSLSKYVKT